MLFTNQQTEHLLDTLAVEQIKDGGLLRTLAKLNTNQRLTGNDYRRLTYALALATHAVDAKAKAVHELEG